MWDLDSTLTNLLLFDTFVADSLSLMVEVPAALDAFGYDGMLSLLRTDALRFHVGHLMAANLTSQGPEDTFAFVDQYQCMPGAYRVANISRHDPEVVLHTVSEALDARPGLTKRKATKLLDAVAAQLVPIPKNYGAVSTFQTYADVLRDSAGLRRAVASWLTRSIQAPVWPNDVQLEVSVETGPLAGDEIGYVPPLHVDSSIAKKFDLSPKETMWAVGESLLAVCRLNARIETMEVCDAIFGLREDESEFIDEKLDFIAREVLPEAEVERFHRVVTMFNLPRLGPAMEDGRLNIEKFIELRDSDVCRQFRAWLRDLDDSTEAEIHQRVESLRAKAGNALHNNEGMLARFIVINGTSFIPLAGPFVSAALSGLDTFMLDRVMPERGPALFLSASYPSIFDASTPPRHGGLRLKR